MKRKLALLLAGCLAISPVSAGYFPVQAFAAESEAGSDTRNPVVVVVKDENETALTAVDGESGSDPSEYTMTVGETRQLTALIEQGTDSPALSIWSSETPEIADIDDDGIITAQAAGTGLIVLSISCDASETPIEIKYEITVAEDKEQEASAEAADTADAVSAEVEAAQETTADEPAAATEETAAEEDTGELEEEIVVELADDINPAGTTDLTEEAGTAAATDTAASEDAEEAAPAAETVAVPAEETAPAAETEAAPAEGAAESAAAEEEILSASVAVETGVVTGNASAKVASDEGETVTPHWTGSGSDRNYIQKDGSKAVGKVEIDGKTYIFDSNGKVQTGWALYENKWYFLNSDGTMKTGWFKSGTTWYFLTDDGSMKTGRLDQGNNSYILNDSGRMCTGWAFYNNKWYYMDKNGFMQKGWLKLGSTWYFLSADGSMKTGRLDQGNNSYIFNSSGKMCTGWAFYNNKWYYMNSSGYMQKGWRSVGGKWYYLSSDGSMKTGWLKDGSWFYLNSDGSMRKGWLKDAGKWYYMDSYGCMKTGWQHIGGSWYYMDSSGAMKTGWLEFSSIEKYYLDDSGKMVTGSRTIDGITYRFNSNGCLALTTNSYSNTEEFIQCIAPLVRKYAPQYGVKVYSPIIAQAILESASGESSLAKTYNNFFGLKCGTLWTGKSVNLRTGEEYTPGTYTTISANFRVYDSLEEGVKGYFEFLFTNRTRYNNLIGETDPYNYLVKIKADGYATSSKYVQNTYNVLKSYNLTRFDD